MKKDGAEYPGMVGQLEKGTNTHLCNETIRRRKKKEEIFEVTLSIFKNLMTNVATTDLESSENINFSNNKNKQNRIKTSPDT